MNNLIETRKKLITPEKAASFLPIFISAGISILIIIFFVIPEYVRSTRVNLELNGFVKKKNDLDNLKSQYKIINQKFEKLSQEKTKMIELVTGGTNLDTLLDKLGEIAIRNNIEFSSIVPVNLMNYVEKTKENNKSKINKNDLNIIDPLLVQGTKKYLIDLTFKTDYINLLSFLRELEFLENVILINSINLNLLSPNSNNDEINSVEKIEVKISTTFYGRP